MGCYLRKTPFAGILNSTMRNNSGPMGAEPGKVINYEFFVNFCEREITRLRSENSALLEYKKKAHRELCRVRDEQKIFGKIHVKTEL